MDAVRRAFHNAFRNAMRSVGVIVILAIAIAPSIPMLIARDEKFLQRADQRMELEDGVLTEIA